MKIEDIEKSIIRIPESGCWIWMKSVSQDKQYGRVFHDGKNRLAHRVIYSLLHGEIPEGECLLHRCDVTYCVNPNHLFIGSYHDNMQDMWNKGRHTKNAIYELNKTKRKLSIDDVEKINCLLSDGLSQDKIAKLFNVCQVTISKIKRKVSYV